MANTLQHDNELQVLIDQKKSLLEALKELLSKKTN